MSTSLDLITVSYFQPRKKIDGNKSYTQNPIIYDRTILLQYYCAFLAAACWSKINQWWKKRRYATAILTSKSKVLQTSLQFLTTSSFHAITCKIIWKIPENKKIAHFHVEFLMRFLNSVYCTWTTETPKSQVKLLLCADGMNLTN